MDNKFTNKQETQGVENANPNKKNPENSRRVRTLNIIMSVVLAVILWAYVIGEVNPETEKTLYGVPLNIVGEKTLEAQGLVVITEFEDTVTAVVKGRRSEIYGMKSSRLSARLDVSECVEGENQVSVKVTAPRNVEEAEAKDAEMVVVVDRLVREDKPVQIAVSGEMREGSNIEILSVSSETVEVYGPSTYVDEVASVVGVLKAKDGQQDYSQTVSLIAVDKSGNAVKDIRLETEEVSVQAVKTLVKSFYVDVKSSGNPAEGVSLEFSDRVRILLKGKYEDIIAIESLEANEVDLTGIDEDTYRNLSVKIPSETIAVDGFGEPLPQQEDGTVVIKVEIKAKKAEESDMEV